MSEFESPLIIPGKRVVVEGNDGTGKSTVADMLAWQVRKNNIRTLRVDEPNSPIDEAGNVLLPHIAELRHNIKDGSFAHNPHADLAMFNVSRHISTTHIENPYMDEGYWMLKARDFTSSLAYQGHAEGLGIDEVYEIIKNTMQDDRYMNPDFKTVLIFEDELERLRRIKHRAVLEVPDTFEKRGPEFQARINEAYPLIAERFGYNITPIRTEQSREEIADTVFSSMVGAVGVQLTKYSWEEYWKEKEAA